MWLLNTKIAEVCFFTRFGDAPSCAILSHIWGKADEEDTFQKVRDAARRCEEMEAERLVKESEARSSAASPIEELRDTIKGLQRIVRRQGRRIDRLEGRVTAMSCSVVRDGTRCTPYIRCSASRTLRGRTGTEGCCSVWVELHERRVVLGPDESTRTT